MGKLRIHGFAVSIDGYGAGPGQDIDNPLGVGGMGLHNWMFGTQTFQRMIGNQGGAAGVDDDFAARGSENIGASIMGRNMFGPIRGPWPNDQWRGWWGEDPPYHTPVFVLTHHARAPVEMEGGTVFHFVTGGIHAALALARKAAGAKDVRLGGGVSVVRQYLEAKLVDEMHLAVSPLLLGAGEQLFSGIDLPSLGYQRREYVNTPDAMHVVFARD
jgi:dihydrofolate reductase